MATFSGGTNANNSLTGVFMAGSMAAADVASIANGIKNDAVNGLPISPGAFSSNGLLYVPNRGVLKVNPGDAVLIDSTGWPILLSAYAVANGPWTT